MKKPLFFILLVLPIVLYGTILHVPDEYTTIQSAIDATSPGDTILVAPGTYYENLVISGKTLTMASMYLLTNDTSYISQTVIDGNKEGRVIDFYMGSVHNLLCGFTITNGESWEGGAGIRILNSSPSIRNCVITNNALSQNSAYNGGGISCENTFYNECAPKFIDVIISNNSAPDGYGGGMYCGNLWGSRWDVTAVLTRVKFLNNHANYGGGIGCDEQTHLTLNHVEFSENTAIGGGALFLGWHSYASLNNVNFIENTATSYGGAVSCWDSGLLLINVKFIGNSANHGGGVYAIECWFNFHFENVLFESNVSATTGGGIYCTVSGPQMKNVTFVENSASVGTAIYCIDNSDVMLSSCILFGNIPQQIVCGSTLGQSFLAISYSNIQGGIHFIETNDNGTIAWGEGNLNRNPMFVGEGEHPYQISDNSWCIDAGDPDTTGQTNMLDLAGEPRLVNDRVDMGAYEWNLMVDTPIQTEAETFNVNTFPNPLITSTNFEYTLSNPSTVQISIYNHLGKQVESIQQNQSQGKHQITWDASGQPSGVYYFQMKAGKQLIRGKLLLVK